MKSKIINRVRERETRVLVAAQQRQIIDLQQEFIKMREKVTRASLERYQEEQQLAQATIA